MSLLIPLALALPIEDPVRARVHPALLHGDHVRTVVYEADDPFDVLEGLQALGVPGLRGGALVQAELEPAAILELAALPGVRRVRPPHRAAPKTEVSEGVDAILVDDWRVEGQTGEGVRVAIVDVGFDGWEALVPSELPDNVVDHTDGATLGSRHGAAVAEIIHELAPDAELAFHAFSTDVEFLAVLDELAEDPPDIVNASIGFDNVYPIDGSSPFAEAVDVLADERVLYIGAAGNEAERYAQGALTDEDGDGWAELGGLETIQIWATGTAEARLRWSEPFGEAGVDLDLYLFDDEDQQLGASTAAQNGSGDPYEALEVDVGTAVSAFARIKIESADVQGLEAWLYSPSGMHSEAVNPAMSLTLPADAEGCLAVGAWLYDEQVLASYSSHGPTQDGRQKPELVAPSQVTTVTFGTANFSGSSAAAPHVSGVAALLVDRKSRARPKKLRTLLYERALDVGDPGVDDATGHGLVQVVDLPCGCASAGAASFGWLWATLLVWRRRCS